MSDEHRTVFMQDDEKILRVRLPEGIGYLEIRTGGVNGPTGYPAVAVEVVTDPHTPAADGRLYSATYTVRDDTVVLVGRPSPELLEMQRAIEYAGKVIKLHDSGDHSKCPESCPAKSGEPTHEHVFEDSELTGLCIADMDCMVTYERYKEERR